MVGTMKQQPGAKRLVGFVEHGRFARWRMGLVSRPDISTA